LKLNEYLNSRFRLDYLINQTLSQEGFALRFNGRNILFISNYNKNKYGQDIPCELNYFLSRACRGSSILVLKRTSYYKHNLCKIFTSMNFNTLVEINSRERTYAFCNDINLLALLSKVIKFQYHRPPIGEFISSIDRNNIYFYIGINSNDYNYLLIDKLSLFFNSIKRIKKDQLVTFSKHDSCLVCKYSIDIHTTHMNLPLCNKCLRNFDLPKIALDIKNRKFNHSKFTRESYLSKKGKCAICSKVRNHISSFGICYECQINSGLNLNNIMDILLGKSTLEDIINKYVTKHKSYNKCVDCGNKSDADICSICEKKYNWSLIDQAIDQGSFTWLDFIRDIDIRSSFSFPTPSSNLASNPDTQEAISTYRVGRRREPRRIIRMAPTDTNESDSNIIYNLATQRHPTYVGTINNRRREILRFRSEEEELN